MSQRFCDRKFAGVCLLGMVLLLSYFALYAAAAEPNSQSISVIASTVPSNGDVNPYGLVIVPASKGKLVEGDLLVSNFNAKSNLQGTGTTIVQVSPSGSVSLFAHIDAAHLPGACPGGIGLTTALVVLRSGWVIVGSLPTTDGTAATAQAGCLLVLNWMGEVVETIYGSLVNGPWDMAAFDDSNVDGAGSAALFVTNVLNGTVAAKGAVVNGGTVVRVNLTLSKTALPFVEAMTVIGSEFSERTDPAALVIGPTGVGLSPDHSKLYVADSLHNRVAVIANPLTAQTTARQGTTLTRGGALFDPLGLFVALDGDVFTVNGDNGYLVETTPAGMQISKTLLDSSGAPPGAGALFGLVVVGNDIYYVDDATNTLNLFQ